MSEINVVMDEQSDERGDPPPRVMPRRVFLGTAAAGTAAAVLAACGGSSSSSTIPAATPPVTIGQNSAQAVLGTDAEGFSFFTDSILNFNTMFAAGASGVASAFGEVVTAVQQAKSVTGGPTYQSYFDSMNAMGNKLVVAAEQSLKDGHVVSARERYLRAASYFDQALFFVLGTSTPSAEKDVYLAMNAAWTAAAGLFEPVFEKVAIPYENTTLPGWFLRAPGAKGRRPTLIVNNGSDAQNVDTYVYGGAAAIERGWNALLFEGPGQGSQLFVDNVVFRPDWEKVVTPIVDFLMKRSDVDAKRIALTGWSMGGELAARAAAFESRLAAVVLDPGYIDIFAVFPEELQKVAESGDQATVNTAWNEVIVPGASPLQQFTLKKRLEIYTQAAHQEALAGKVPTDWYTISRTMQEYTTAAVAHQITMPALVVTYEEDSTLTSGSATPSIATLLPKGSTTEVTLGTDTGSEYHCAPMNPEWRNEVVFDWLEKTLA
jgi:pimeloyl-ACP methyl ester carboxylesterase